MLVEITIALDIATVPASGLQIKDDCGHIALSDSLQQDALGQIQIGLDHLFGDALKRIMAPNIVAHARRRARAIGLRKLLCRVTHNAAGGSQRLLDVLDLEFRFILNGAVDPRGGGNLRPGLQP